MFTGTGKRSGGEEVVVVVGREDVTMVRDKILVSSAEAEMESSDQSIRQWPRLRCF